MADDDNKKPWVTLLDQVSGLAGSGSPTLLAALERYRAALAAKPYSTMVGFGGLLTGETAQGKLAFQFLLLEDLAQAIEKAATDAPLRSAAQKIRKYSDFGGFIPIVVIIGKQYETMLVSPDCFAPG